MAITEDQQASLDANNANEIRRTRLEVVRMAKETLLENARSKPVDARDVTANDITAFADVLNAYVNQ
jgi:hypothetical protein